MGRPIETLKPFLLRVESFERLQLVLELAATPARPFTVDELSAAAPTVPDVAIFLDELVTAGIVVRDPRTGGATLAPDAVADAVDLLASYRENPLPIVQVLSENAIERVRTAAARIFADAFVLGRKDRG